MGEQAFAFLYSIMFKTDAFLCSTMFKTDAGGGGMGKGEARSWLDRGAPTWCVR